jgi:riboflavin kinase/FMN adenylyltransferase
MEKTFVGNVVHGQKKGRELGFPTANIEFSGELDEGVYSGWTIIDEKKYQAGIMHRNETNILEAHILDFSGEIYGKKIQIEIGKKIRELIKFKTNEELIMQIKKDVELIRK